MPGLAEFLLVLPFGVVVWLSHGLYPRTGAVKYAVGICLVSTIVLLLNGAWGYYDYQRIIAERKWTAAAFATARTGFLGLGVAGAAWFAAQRITDRILKQRNSGPR